MVGSQIFEIFILVVIAVALLIKLSNVLGIKNGHEKILGKNKDSDISIFDNISKSNRSSDNDKGKKYKGDEEKEDISIFVNSDDSVREVLQRAKVIDKDFFVSDFMEGARSACNMLLTAFYDGEREPLEKYTSNTVYNAFESEIHERLEKGMYCEFSYVYMRLSEIIAASISDDNVLEISVKFISDIILTTYNSDGSVNSGDSKKIVKIMNIWTFSRKLNSDELAWIVVATAEE